MSRLVAAATLVFLTVLTPNIRSGAQTTSIDELIVEPGFNTDQADILRLYRAFFDREPDEAGTVYWLDVAADGAPLDSIAENFAVSDEFLERYGNTTDAEFLTIVYRNVLGRSYDQGGFDYWLGKLTTELTRGGTVRWVAANDEFVDRNPYPKQQLVVTRVVDGDSLEISDGRSVRLAQVDGPEFNECFGPEATAELDRLVGGNAVYLRRPADAPALDKYDRSVAEVLVMNGSELRSVNEALIRQGFGEYDESFADEDPALAARLDAAETEARRANRGLWASCSSATTPQQVPTAPIQPLVPTGNCHPAYTPCVPPGPPDLDCKDIGRPVTVDRSIGDPHRLDGDRDGRGCESYG